MISPYASTEFLQKDDDGPMADKAAMRNADNDAWAPPNTADMPPYQTRSSLKPYLGLRSRMLLGIISPSILALLFIIVRLLVSSADLNSRVALAKASLMQECTAAEAVVGQMLSWGHFAAQGINQRTKKSVEGSVRALGEVLLLGCVLDSKCLPVVVRLTSLPGVLQHHGYRCNADLHHRYIPLAFAVFHSAARAGFPRAGDGRGRPAQRCRASWCLCT